MKLLMVVVWAIPWVLLASGRDEVQWVRAAVDGAAAPDVSSLREEDQTENGSWPKLASNESTGQDLVPVAKKPASEGRIVGSSFTAAPTGEGGIEGAADSIRAIRFGVHDGFERLVINFGLRGETSSRTPAWSLSSPTGEGYARITFPGVIATSVTDGAPGGYAIEDFYVVRDPGGGVFVDAFATGAFRYRITELLDPGRLVIDYRHAGAGLEYPLPIRDDDVVVMQPREGEAAGSSLTVSGYSRNFEASNTVTLLEPGGRTLASETTLANDWAETWGYYEVPLRIPAYEGEAILRVGNQSPRNGAFDGVEVPITVGAK